MSVFCFLSAFVILRKAKSPENWPISPLPHVTGDAAVCVIKTGLCALCACKTERERNWKIGVVGGCFFFFFCKTVGVGQTGEGKDTD